MLLQCTIIEHCYFHTWLPDYVMTMNQFETKLVKLLKIMVKNTNHTIKTNSKNIFFSKNKAKISSKNIYNPQIMENKTIIN